VLRCGARARPPAQRPPCSRVQNKSGEFQADFRLSGG
jgi:hypothetical protein